MITSTKSAVKAAALLLAKQAAVVLASFLLAVFFVIAIAGVIVAAILAVIYNSLLAVFFPLPDTGYDNPRTVFSEYYRDFNQHITALEEAFRYGVAVGTPILTNILPHWRGRGMSPLIRTARTASPYPTLTTS